MCKLSSPIHRSRQGIRDNIVSASDVLDLKVEILKF